MARLNNPDYMQFPFEIGASGSAVSQRGRHIRDQIEQVLFTTPGERIFRPDFGAGLKNLIFEPNNHVLAELTRKRLLASLSEALKGEVDPGTLEVDVTHESEKLLVVISYTLATISRRETQTFEVK